MHIIIIIERRNHPTMFLDQTATFHIVASTSLNQVVRRPSFQFLLVKCCIKVRGQNAPQNATNQNVPEEQLTHQFQPNVAKMTTESTTLVYSTNID